MTFSPGTEKQSIRRKKLLKFLNFKKVLIKKGWGEMKPNGVSDNVYNDLINALEKAILLIYDMSIRKVAIPYDTIARWENLVRYAREEGDE